MAAARIDGSPPPRRGGAVVRFRRRGWGWTLPALLAAVAFTMTVTADCSAAVPASAASPPVQPRIEVSSPSAYQVVQRDAAGLADIVVRGRLVGLSGPVQVRWSSGTWSAGALLADGPVPSQDVVLPAGPGRRHRAVGAAPRRRRDRPLRGRRRYLRDRRPEQRQRPGQASELRGEPGDEGRPLRQRRPLGPSGRPRRISPRGRSTT